MKGLLLAGGYGTRLRPFTFCRNKHMIPVANRPMVFHALDRFARAGITEVGVVLGPMGEGIRTAVGDGRSFGLRVSYVEQGEPKGLAHAVLIARDFLGKEPFVMHLGDNFLQEGLAPFVSEFRASHPAAVIGAVQVDHPSYYGVVEFDGADRIARLREKPANPTSRWALTGIYLFTNAIHDVIDSLPPSERGELEITDAIEELRRRTDDVRAVRLKGWWLDAGRPSDLLLANEHLLTDLGAAARARGAASSVLLGTDCSVADSVALRGPVLIGNGVRLEGRSVIGPNVSIGDRSVVRDSSLSGSMVFDECQLTGPLQLTASILGSRSRVTGIASSAARLDSLLLGDDSVVRLDRRLDSP